MTGVAEFTISEIEAGKRANPRPSTLRKLAQALEVEVAELYGDPTYPKDRAQSPDSESDWRPSLRSWIDLTGRTADRWEADFDEREREWQNAEPHIRRHVKWLPNLSWATEIRSTYVDVLKATNAELNYGLYVYETAEVQELFKNNRRLEEILERTEPWYQGEEAPRMAEVIHLWRDFAERVEMIKARRSQSA